MRLILLFLFSSLSLFATISTPIHTKIISVNTNEITASNIEGAQVGMFGAIVHTFDATHSTALSWVEVKSIESDIIHLSTSPITALEQSALPSGIWTPKVDDQIVLGYNYQRALLIAPSSSVYKKITNYHQERSWVHPDIFATNLSALGHPTPLREDFSSTCRENNIGIVAFMFDKSIISVDCQSFKILENKSTSIAQKDVQLPFYTRVPNILANWFGEGSGKMQEYSPYYIELLAKNNPKNSWIQNYRDNALGKEDDSSWFGSFFSGITIEYDDGKETDLEEVVSAETKTENEVSGVKVPREDKLSDINSETEQSTEEDGETIMNFDGEE